MTDRDRLNDFAQRYLKVLIAEAAESLDADFDAATPFGELGIDSFRVLRIVKALEQDFGRLPKTLLFENYHVQDLAAYFVDEHADTLRAMASRGGDTAATAPATPAMPAPAAPAAPAEVTPAVIATVASAPAGPILGLEHALRTDATLGPWVRQVFEDHRNDGSVSRGTRNIAPNLFIGHQRRGYFHYARAQDRVLAYAYTGPDDHYAELAAEFCRHCIADGLHPNLMSAQVLADDGDLRFSATPFGVLQRIVGLRDFTLAGPAMRRLRYLVNKFEKQGDCRTVEFRHGPGVDTDPATVAAIAGVIDAWCGNRTMVNPLIHKVRREILAGALDPAHRIFVTYLDEVLQNVILISPLAARLNGYLMDLEFYGADMPLGGLEFAISRIIATLVDEGCDVFSLGGTHGCRLEEETGAHADPDIDRVLGELRERELFNDAGNLQFKNKFRPDNHSIYLCRPQGTGDPQDVIDLIMMIADPDRMQSSDAARQAPAAAGAVPVRARAMHTAAPTAPATSAVRDAPLGVRGVARSYRLAEGRFNPLNLRHDQVEFDLKTDSWAQLRRPAIDARGRHLHACLHGAVDTAAALASVFPFPHVTLTTSGRNAERVLYRAWPRKGVVLQTLLFPTNLFHQIDNGFTPRELPRASVFALHADAADKAELDLDAVRAALADAAGIAMVCVEAANNAAGGQAVSAAHLRAIAALLAPHGIPLVLDATRVLDNVAAGSPGTDLWAGVRELLDCADVIVASLPKNFGVAGGGLVATRDAALHARLQDAMVEDGCGLGAMERRLLGLALRDRAYLEQAIAGRQAAVRRLGAALIGQGVPVVQPVGAHCVLVDVAAVDGFATLREPVPSFLAWLYLATGIRGAGHNAGMGRDHALAGTVRLALPLGIETDEVDEIARRIGAAWALRRDIPDLEAGPMAGMGDIHAGFQLRGYLHASGPVEPFAAEDASATGAAGAGPQPTLATATPAPAAAAPASIDVAIVGMAGRYPQARNPHELWRLLVEGRDCVADIPDARLALRQGEAAPVRYRGGFIDDVEMFDAGFFGIAGRDALIMDPQERQFLEVAHEALEDAGYTAEALGGEDGQRDIGVFVGAVWSSYQMVGADEKRAGRAVNPSSFLWSIANRVSYWMDLHGPSLTLDSACSASLTALKLACDAIRSGECRAAIVGGVNLDLHQSKYDINASGGSLSRGGVCRAYGQGADGYVSGEGVGALVLKPLHQAIADRDQVYGVIKAVVATHSGRTSAYTVPNPRTQADLVAKALKVAGVDARSIGYVEGHGTGTDLGDSIEIAGLGRAFAAHGVAPGACPIGSIKTNIGHLEAASGIVGLQKILLQMRHATLVPSLHAAVANENIDFDTAPLRIQRDLSPWDCAVVDGQAQPRRAGLSAIGIGGANAHVIVEQHTPAVREPEQAGPRVVPLSARTPAQLHAMAARLLAHLRQATQPVALDDIAFTLAQGRRSFDHRVAVIASDVAALEQRLAAFVAGEAHAEVLLGEAGNARGVTAMLDAQEREDFVALMLRRGDPGRLARLWSDGLIADARAIASLGGHRVSLPTYPFEGDRYWIAETANATAAATADAPEPRARPVAGASPVAVVPTMVAPTMEAPPARTRYRFWSEDGPQAGMPDIGMPDIGMPGVAQEALPVAEKAGLFVRQTLADCLDVPIESLRDGDGLLEIGLTSLDMAGLTTGLKARFGAKFSPTAFFECRTIGDFSGLLAERYRDRFESMRLARLEIGPADAATPARRPVRGGDEAIADEVYLQDAASPLALPEAPWPPLAGSPACPRILLTGATGFLGIHMLHALCAGDGEVRVVCLVRAADADAARARLRAQAARFDLVLDEGRIEVLCGDVCAPRLGLDQTQWDDCCARLDQIVHAAAHVNHIEGYASFRDATGGMKEIIRLAASRRPKLVQFMSSTAACILKAGDSFAVYEHESFIDGGEQVYGGYGQSKWVQETLLRRAADRGVPYVIYRFGELSGSSRSGHAQTDDMLHRLLQMRLAVGCREKVSSDVLDAVPVDVAARLVAGTAHQPSLWNAILHGTHLLPCPIARVYRTAEQRLGRTYAPVTRQHYLDACLEHVRQVYERSPLDGFVLECVLRDAEGSSRQRKIMDGYFAVLFPFEQSNFSRALDALRVALPAWDALLATYFDRWCGADSDYLVPARGDATPRAPAPVPRPRVAAAGVPAPNVMQAALERVDEI